MRSAISPLIAAVEAQLLALPCSLALEWPGGRAGAASSPLRLKLRQRELLGRLAQGRIGDLADAYVRGDLEIEGTLSDLMLVAGALAGDPVARGVQARWLQCLMGWRARWRRSQARDAEQVRAHYDLGDEFFALWLDPLRVYSCAYFDPPTLSLAQAQEAKLELICRKLQLAPDMRLLDVGCGWGGLLMWAVRHHGVRAVGLTLSRHQHAHVSRLIDDARLGHRAEVRLLDYRDLRAAGQFDRIASVGMFEHVGRARLAGYANRMRGLLRPGGLLLNHGIAAGGLDHAQLGAGMGDFIERHIFPGGELVHVSVAIRALAQGGLELLDAENLRPHYARTLWQWSARLEEKMAAARRVTTEATVRAYRLYLAGSAMCFERGWLALYQLLAARPGGQGAPGLRLPAGADYPDYPFTRRHMLCEARPSDH